MSQTETQIPPPAAEPIPLGTPSAPVGDGDAVSAPAADDQGDGSLAAHEAAFTKKSEPASDEDRDSTGRFKPRRRAASQQAEPDDVPAINELTKRLKTIEETHGKDIARKDGESDRVYHLRRRAELLERFASGSAKLATSPPAAPQPTAPPAAAPAPVRQAAQIPQAFPTYEQFIAIDGMADATYEDYVDARADWRYSIQREQERRQDAVEKSQREFQTNASAHQQRVTAAKQKYTDWDTVVTANLPISRVIHDAVLKSESSADIQYYLGAHRDVLAALVSESQDYSSSAVAAMRRYLDSLVAAPQRTSPPARAAAGTTGSALTLAPPPAPRPPNPVRTSAETPDEEPPGDDSMSLAAHEKHFGRARRR